MARLAADDWVRGGLELLAIEGPGGLRVEPLARHLGVTKGSFYHHFASAAALRTAVLESWEQLATLAVIEHVEATGLDAAQRLRRLGTYVGKASQVDRVEGQLRSWAAIDSEAATVAARVDERRISYVEELLVESGISASQARDRSDLMYRVLIGDWAWTAAGGPSMRSSALHELFDLLLQPT